MAGKLLTLEEAAERLGMSVDDVHRLIDRKELFPLRDGNTLKFKHDDIERLAASGGGSLIGGDSGLSIDIDTLDVAGVEPAAADALDDLKVSGGLDLADSLKLDADDVAGVTGSGPTRLSASAAPAVDLPSESGGLVLDDEAASISANAATPEPTKLSDAAPPDEEKTRPFDLGELGNVVSGLDLGEEGSNATGSLPGASGPEAMSLSGAMSSLGPALSGLDEGGISLEDSDIKKSAILSGASEAAKSGLAGEEFEEFDPVPDDESGSDVVAEGSEAASSSFLEDDGSSSVFPGDGSGGQPAFDAGGDIIGDFEAGADLVRDTSFSVWQICGLVCCALLMLTGGFVMFDLIRTLGSPEDLSLSGPLITPMADLFGWRR